MKYILDSDTLIDYMKDRSNARSSINSMLRAGDELFLSVTSVAEVYSGLTDKDREQWEDFLLALPYLVTNREAAIRAGMDRFTAARSGTTISVMDALLGALAREQDAVILTSNIKDYPMKDVRVLSLREEAA
jgi:predicted nucleic acid-binding protein